MRTEDSKKSTRSNKPVAIGMGLVALDMVFAAADKLPPKCYAGGTCGNVLTILSYLGWRSLPVSRLRGDKAGERLVQDLRRWHVSTQFITQLPDGSTPIIVQRIKRSAAGVVQHSFSWRCPSCGGYLPGYKPVLASTIETVALKVPRASVFFFDRVSRGTLLMAKISRKRGAVVVFEPASVSDPALFREAWDVSHIVKYSHERLREMAELGLGQAGKEGGVLLEIETIGAEGLRYRSRLPNAASRGWSNVGSYPVSGVKDTSGAGDWCTAGLLHTLAQKGATALAKMTQPQLNAALEYGQALAAWNCRFEGARGGMYQSTQAQFDSDVRNILRGTAAADGASVMAAVKSSGDVAELCHWCNEQSSREKVTARRKKA